MISASISQIIRSQFRWGAERIMSKSCVWWGDPILLTSEQKLFGNSVSLLCSSTAHLQHQDLFTLAKGVNKSPQIAIIKIQPTDSVA